MLGRALVAAALCVLLQPHRRVQGGIHGLGPLLIKEAPGCCMERTLQDFEGKKLAIDASMAIYQFLIAVRVADHSGVRSTLTSASGEDTSHLQGFFWRTIAMCRNGIKPIYVFDGRPPQLKSGEIAKRNARRDDGAARLKEAEELGAVEDMNKFSKRTLRVTKQHNDDCKTLLKLMGIPTLDAPCEAEASCAALCKAGLVYATATEDMDALCCGSPVLVRRLTFSEARANKQPVLEYRLDKVLQGLQLNMTQFVDFCILCGCDFAGTIRGIGPKTALNGIRKHGSIEALLQTLNTTKNPPPDEFPLDEVRHVLVDPEVVDTKNLTIQWETPPDEVGLIKFLVRDKVLLFPTTNSATICVADCVLDAHTHIHTQAHIHAQTHAAIHRDSASNVCATGWTYSKKLAAQNHRASSTHFSRCGPPRRQTLS